MTDHVAHVFAGGLVRAVQQLEALEDGLEFGGDRLHLHRSRLRAK